MIVNITVLVTFDNIIRIIQLLIPWQDKIQGIYDIHCSVLSFDSLQWNVSIICQVFRSTEIGECFTMNEHELQFTIDDDLICCGEIRFDNVCTAERVLFTKVSCNMISEFIPCAVIKYMNNKKFNIIMIHA